MKDPFANELGPALAAKTDVTCIAQYPCPLSSHGISQLSLLKVIPHSGRYHQIRRHLQAIGHPIVGDYLYGNVDYNQMIRAQCSMRRLMLLAHKLTFVHPTSQQTMTVESEIPEAFLRLKYVD